MNSENVSLDQAQEVLQASLRGSARSSVLDGEPELNLPNEPMIKVVIAGGKDPERFGFVDARRDSTADVRIPDPDIDSKAIYDFEVSFFVGPGVLILIGGQGSISREALDFFALACVRAIRKIDFDSRPYYELGREVKDVGLDVLSERTGTIEATVRDALSDEEFSQTDLIALRNYPERLAKVESAAESLREEEPTWESAEPPSRYPRISAVDVDFSHKWAGDRAREARAATGRLATLISSQQIVLTQRQAHETARFQRTVTIVGAAVLVPGLVAAIFGANVGFHGRDTSSAFWAMLLFMVGSAATTYALVRSLEYNLLGGLAEKPLVRSLARIPIAVRVIATAVFGAAILVAATVIFFGASSPRTSPGVVQSRESPQAHRYRDGAPVGPSTPSLSTEQEHHTTQP